MAKLDYQTELSHLNNVWCLKNYQPKMIRTKVNSRGSLLDVSETAELLIATKPKYSKIKYSSTDRNLELKLSEDLAFLSTHNVLITGIPVQSVIPVYIHCCQ